MYIFIRSDLSLPQQIVQSSHASAIIGEKYHSNTSIVLISCKDEDHLKSTAQYLQDHQIKFEIFYEPDVNEFTSIATEPLIGESRKNLKKFKLMQ